MHLHRLIYAKKALLPSKAAHVLQSLNMAYAFADNAVSTIFWPGIDRADRGAFMSALEHDHGLVASRDLHVHSLPGWHKGAYGLGFRFNLLRAWCLEPPDTVFYARDITEALLLARFKRFTGQRHRVFYEAHEVLSEQHQRLGTGRARYFERVEAEMLAGMDGVVCISPVLVEALARAHGYAGPTLVAPMGFNHRLFSPVPDVDFSGSIVIAYVGSLYESKGVHALVRAMRYLPERFRLLVIGGNPERELVRLGDLARDIPNGERRIELAGFLPPSRIGERLAGCSIMVIPQISEVEFFSPIKLYEAIGMGLPLVVTPVPALTSALEPGVDAVMATGTDPRALAEAVLEMAGDERRARSMQARCRKRAETSTWTARAARCLAFMDDVAGKTPKSRPPRSGRRATENTSLR